MESSYVRLARRRWPVIGLCLIVGLGAAFGISGRLAKSYQGHSEVFINVLGGNNVPEALDAAQLSSQLIQSYAYVAESNSVARQVQTTLRLKNPPQMTATPLAGTLLLNLTADEPDPALARAVVATATTAFASAIKGYQAGNGTSVIVRTVQFPSASTTAVSPRRSLDLVYGGASGLLVGLALAAILDYSDKSFRDPAELEGLLVGPLLGRVPRLKSVGGSDLLLDRENDLVGLESYGTLRAALRFLDPGRPLCTILFTSPGSGDGKTTTAANLADVLASSGETVIGVDADLRNPKLAQAFGVSAEPGLTSVIIGAEPLAIALRWNGRLGILPPGELPPNPSELLGSQPMVGLIETLSGRADRVLIDGPATLSVSDPLTLAPLVDGVILVLRPGKTSRDDIAETCRRLEVIGARTVGHVLNMTASHQARVGRQAPRTGTRTGQAEDPAHTRPVELAEGRRGSP